MYSDFYDYGLCDSKVHQKSITFDKLTQEKRDIIFLSRRHDKFDNEKENYILKERKDGEFKFGGYVGSFVYEGEQYTIKSRFGDLLLKEMLKRVESILFNHISIQNSDTSDITEQILQISFINYLKKAKLNGFINSYTKKHYRDYTIHGKLDIKNFIKKDLPFSGKISSSKNELHPDVYVAKVLLKAYTIITKQNPKLKNIDTTLNNFLKENSDGSEFRHSDLQKALNAKSIQNPMYKNYKKALELAKIIILKQKRDLNTSNDKRLNFGYLLYAPNLFEEYIKSLIEEVLENDGRNFDLKDQYEITYTNNKKLRADYVIQGLDEKNIVVLDAKYRHFFTDELAKRDIENLCQISRYIAAYQTRVGILIYAMNSFKCEYNEQDNLEPIYILEILRNTKRGKEQEEIFNQDIKSFKEKLAEILKKIK
ncbi:hypothetical protein U5B43_07415 [Campylobacter sp. 9BO]|uniref:5-methylcytosine restriction system specificity protein McrC n=1 Tax=Campylobacter sp. 9BO TaxID=3424759 RepID=UPI003D342997